MAKTPTSTPASEDAPPVTSDTQAYGAYSTDILSTFPSWAMIFDFQYDSSGFVLVGQYIVTSSRSPTTIRHCPIML